MDAKNKTLEYRAAANKERTRRRRKPEEVARERSLKKRAKHRRAVAKAVRDGAPLPVVLPEARPECFHSTAEWVGWRDAAMAADALGEYSSSSFCADCTPAYKEQEMAANRCRHPRTQFRRDPDVPAEEFDGRWHVIGIRVLHSRLKAAGDGVV